MRPSLLLAAILTSIGAAAACGGETTTTSSTGPGGEAGGSGGTSAAGSAGVGGTAANAFLCASPVPAGPYPGLERCANGALRRATVVACPNGLPREQPPLACRGSEGQLLGNCDGDAACTAKAHGYCSTGMGSCFCSYGCLSDADCGAGKVCLCGEPVGHCVLAACATNADCASGSCLLDLGNGCGGESLACPAAADVCASRDDCGGEPCTRLNASRAFVCTGQCISGRPLQVLGAPVLAKLAPGAWV